MNGDLCYRRHQTKFCRNKSHKNFKSNGFYLVQNKPVWKYNCLSNFFLTNSNVSFLNKMSYLTCNCTTQKNCIDCNMIFPHRHFLPVASYKLFIPISTNLKLVSKINSLRENQTKNPIPSPKFFPCHCKLKIFCTCLPEEEKAKKKIIKRHDKKICAQKSHSKFSCKKGLYEIAYRPVWKYQCKMKFNDYQIVQIETLCKIYNLYCKCTFQRKCDLCLHLCFWGRGNFDKFNIFNLSQSLPASFL